MKNPRGRPPIGKQAMSDTERHKRYMARLRKRAAGQVVTREDVLAWWLQATDEDIAWLCRKLGIEDG